MDCAVLLIEACEQKQFKAALNIVFPQLKFRLDFVYLLVLQGSVLEQVHVKGNLRVVES